MDDELRALSPADEPAALLDEMVALREGIVGAAEPWLAAQGATGADARLTNLAHYMALRRRDLRALQRRLMRVGLSSLGRLESRVLPTLDAVTVALAALAGRPIAAAPAPDGDAFFRGEARLAAETDALFGPARAARRGRIMVTLPGSAATDPGLILDLARRGMDIARINCAHDDAAAWRAIAAHVRSAGEAVGRRLTVLMDVAGPKIRIEAVVPERKAKVQAGDAVRLTAAGLPVATPEAPFCAVVSLPAIVERVRAGDRVRYDDGKMEGVVERTAPGEAIIRITRTKPGGAKLKPEKGLNMPDTDLDLSPLTSKDEGDLAAVVACADMVGYSFVSRPEDIDLLEAALARHGEAAARLGIVAKIEQPRAVSNLPDLIARVVATGRPFGVMIARGDLAAEIGFERTAEMQEEILWICEAASVPTIWATQVLEDLVKDGLPSRGEMTDAAMAARAECVMLNKGPHAAEAVTLLDGMMGRMDEHIFKKTPTLRALKSW
ncbi:pyruvate kinase [Aquibium sp. ELW1220]|uniref:pyruvate kinase n=1 Tax=Aquibium sp. ELW1220 TaxID=2976766 RepID=UPI0025B22C72|nr:pyruvate kinase [Aquibium sp. ELW1220]MDN2583629.1 pyruvate kinase [Aquibium sp. ELW1220]